LILGRDPEFLAAATPWTERQGAREAPCRALPGGVPTLAGPLFASGFARPGRRAENCLGAFGTQLEASLRESGVMRITRPNHGPQFSHPETRCPSAPPRARAKYLKPRPATSAILESYQPKCNAMAIRFGAVAKAPPSPGFFGFIGSVCCSLGRAVRGLVRGVTQSLVGVARNFVSTLREALGSGVAALWKAPVGVLKVSVNGVLMVGGTLLSRTQEALGLEPRGRRLSLEEQQLLRRVFGDSIHLDAVRIKQGDAGVFSLSDRPFTLGNTIYFKSTRVSLPALVHEMVHVWQSQKGGPDYSSESLWGQSVGEGYDWEKGRLGGKSWSELNPEQQAQLIQDAYRAGLHEGRASRSETTERTAYLLQAMSELRAGRGAP